MLTPLASLGVLLASQFAGHGAALAIPGTLGVTLGGHLSSAPVATEPAAVSPIAGANVSATGIAPPPAGPPPPALIPVQDSRPADEARDQAPTETVPPAPAPVPEIALAPAPGPETVPVPDPAVISPTEQRAVLKSAARALSDVRTAEGRFVQFDDYGRELTGRFALQRPGRMRFDYDDPSPILLAADGTNVAIRDEALEEVDRVPLATTPLNLVLDDDLDFETEAEVVRVRRANGILEIAMRDRSGEMEGELTLVFEAASYDLMGWRVVDANDSLTTVRLDDVVTGVRLDPRLFRIRDFGDEEEDRDR